MAAKEMMMAERPSGGGTDGPSIGNYKGVMLCNRPFAGTAVAAKAMAAQNTGDTQRDGPLPFRAGIQKETIGLNPPKKLRYAHSHKKRNSALANHKKWLKELSRTKEELQAQHLEELKEAAERRKRFLEREREVRAAILETMGVKSPEPEEENVSEEQLNKEIKELVVNVNAKDGNEGESKEEKSFTQSLTEAQKKKLERKEKPAWALTQEKYAEAKEEKEEEEVDELLSFAENLDFEQYVADYEIRAALEKVRDRISELSRHKDLQESKDEEKKSEEANEEELKSLKLTEKALIEHERKFTGGESKVSGDDAKSIASALSEAKSLRSIHSTKSLKAVINKLKEQGSTLTSIQETKMSEPLIVKIDEEGGSRLNKKSDPSQLPYMHRNPAV